MKKWLYLTVIMAVLAGGCASTSRLCQNEAKFWEYKGKIASALSMVQVGYPAVVAAAIAVKPNMLDPAKVDAGAMKVMVSVRAVDAALGVLGRLFFDVACPTDEDLATAEKELVKAQAAKAELGV